MPRSQRRPVAAGCVPTGRWNAEGCNRVADRAPTKIPYPRVAEAASQTMATGSKKTAKINKQLVVADVAPTKIPLSPALQQAFKKKRPVHELVSNGDIVRADLCQPSPPNGLCIEESFAALSMHTGRGQEEPNRLNIAIMYGGALQRSGLYFIIGVRDAAAVVGWDVDKCQLRFNEYHIVTPLYFMDIDCEPVNVLECTCKESIPQRQRLRGLDNNIPLSEQVILQLQREYCIHRSILDTVGVRLFASLEEVPDIADCEIEQHSSDPVLLWSVKTGRHSYGIVKRSKRGNLSCLTCRKQKCEHVTAFLSHYKEFDIELPPILPVEEAEVVLSREAISYYNGFLAAFSFPVTGDLYPTCSDQLCEHGASWCNSEAVTCMVGGKEGIIYDALGQPYRAGTVTCKIADGPCRCKFFFDGKDKGVVNVNNRHFVEYRLLVHYMHHFARDGLPLVAFNDVLAKLNRDSLRSTIPYDVLYRSWTGFAKLVTLSDEAGFTCPSCGKYPTVIVLDGTALSCRKDLLPKIPTNSANNMTTLHGMPHEKRVLISEKKTRDLLNTFATGKRNGKKAELTVEDVRVLLERVSREFPSSALKRLLDRLTLGGQCKADKEYRLFLRELSKNTPICGHFQLGRDIGDATRALRSIIDGSCDVADPHNADLVDKMRVWFPGMLECLFPIRGLHGNLPEDVRMIIQMMVNKLSHQFELLDARSVSDYADIDEDDPSLGFFPAWPVLRGRGKYRDDGPAKDEADMCSKFRHGHRVLGPGIMLYLCPHAVIYGFSVMQSYESPRMAFEVFCSRYIPPNVIYDNACKLHVYCLKREPLLFRCTRFFVDRLHWYNHSACSISYCMDRYACDSVLANVNSQVNEQLNSCLQNLRRSLSYMTYKKFVCHLKLFLYLRNMDVISKF